MTAAGQADHSYGEEVNQRLLDFIGSLSGTVLDVGCGTGQWAPQLRRLGAGRLLALEPSADADAARLKYDGVMRCTVEEAPLSFIGETDTIIAADVLEHLPDPWAVLRRLREGVQPGTRLVVSLPNAQAARQLVPILLQGKFDYSADGGWLDVGHLRWFTQRTLTEALTRTSWRPVREGGYVLGRMSNMILRATAGRATGLAYFQLHVDAVAC